MKIATLSSRGFGNTREERKLAERLFAQTTRRSRAAVFFTEFQVSDTTDGRLDLLILHAWMVLDRVPGSSLSRAFVDQAFLSFEEALRQLGTGDVGMTRRLKTLANAFYGRLEAYRQAKDVGALAEAIGRNVYRGDQARAREAQALATYVWSARCHLAKARIELGDLDFGPIPGG